MLKQQVGATSWSNRWEQQVGATGGSTAADHSSFFYLFHTGSLQEDEIHYCCCCSIKEQQQVHLNSHQSGNHPSIQNPPEVRHVTSQLKKVQEDHRRTTIFCFYVQLPEFGSELEQGATGTSAPPTNHWNIPVRKHGKPGLEQQQQQHEPGRRFLFAPEPGNADVCPQGEPEEFRCQKNSNIFMDSWREE